jgi:uncharacterized protein (UPF0305 family)
MRDENHKVFYCPIGTRRVDMGKRNLCRVSVFQQA